MACGPRRPNPVFSEAYGAIRDVLLAARREAGLSQRALAARLGKAASHVALIERGQRRVDLLEFHAIAGALHLAPVELFARIARRVDQVEAAAPGEPRSRAA